MFNDIANVNSYNAAQNPDGNYTISFGCGEQAINNIGITNDTGVFNVLIRHYRPSQAVINGYRIAPKIQPVTP